MATPLNTKTSTSKLSKLQTTIEKKISSLLNKKYYIDENYYNICLINDIIYNEKSHVVALFKNYLILDDDSEFLKRFYSKKESSVRLPKFFEYYDTYSKIFPNYTILAESKYIFKNIHKKQKMIDQQQENNSNNSEEKEHKLLNESKTDDVFSTDVYNSIVNDYDDIAIIFNIRRDNDNNDSVNNDDNDIKKINTLIEMIIIKEKITNSSQKINKHTTCTFQYHKTKNPVLTPRVNSNKHSNFLNKQIPKGNKESISRFIQQELRIHKNKNTITINKSNDHSIKSDYYGKRQLINQRSSSIDQKLLQSTAISNQIPDDAIRPLTHRESSCSKLQENDITSHIDNNIVVPPETERIRVNIRPMREATEIMKKNIISQIRANNKFFFQSKIIASQFNQTLKLGNGNRDNLLSPQATARMIINEKETSNNSVIALKTDLNKTSKNQSNMIKPCNNNYQDKKVIKYSGSSKANTYQTKDCEIHTIRPKSRTNQQCNTTKLKNNFNNHKHLVINDKKDLPFYHIPIPGSANKSPKKIVKGIEIKNFNKALGLFEVPFYKINTERHNNCRGNKVKIPV